MTTTEPLRPTELTPPGMAIDDPDGTILADIQGNILRGYNMSFVRHVVVRVADAAAARAFIGAVLSGTEGVPQLTTATPWVGDEKPDTCLNVGVTASGLAALGLAKEALATFPREFVQGAAARAVKVGDVGASAPEHWRDGLDDPDAVHLMWTIHALDDADKLDAVARGMEERWRASGAFTVTTRLDGATFDTYTNDLADHDTVHYGYRDSISQPRFVVNGEFVGRADAQPVASVGAVLLGAGYRSTFPGVAWQQPEARRGSAVVDLATNGCFNAFRVLEQDVDAFEDFLRSAVAQIDAEVARRRAAGEPTGTDGIEWDEERVAAKLMGRWRNGVPLSLSHWTAHGGTGPPFAGPGQPPPLQDDARLNAFDYPDDDLTLDDFDGVHCPMGADIRRSNPRSAQIVQRSANFTRPIVRRGMPYGPPYDPAHPRDGHRRGLLGVFLCASLIAQYEAIMYDWINLGLQDPRITSTNDPIAGANREATGRFVIPLPDAAPIVLTGMPRFTETVGAAYLFCPSVSTLRYLAEGCPN